ncbi:DUF3231 family protein [Cytobacillus horneckiae]|uniref:DUF3231 family protein n=1 Tax=Cytobacillus horneckiae TaxID=549687 RepID=UPI003D9A5EF5
MANKRRMSSSELGALWMTYQKKTMILRILEYFIETSENKQAKKLMNGLWKELNPKVGVIEQLFRDEGAAVPQGFTDTDVDLNAPKLFDKGFDILLCRILKEISMGLYTLHMTMSYREDIIDLYTDLTKITQKYYKEFTEYLLANGYLSVPNYVNMPNSINFITDKNYTKGFSLVGNKRGLNTIEFSYLFNSIQTNAVGLQLITGFAQTAQNQEVQKYMLNGKKLCKEIIKGTEEILVDSDILPSAINGIAITKSNIPPFSDKMAVYLIFLLSNFGLGGQGFGAGFSLRDDINLKLFVYAKDIYQFIREGIKVMIDNGWMEEPPKMDVNGLK